MPRRLRAGAGAARLAGGALALAVALAPAAAAAFCRTTTCALAKPPPECKERTADGCLAHGIPLSWKQGCVSYSVWHDGTSNLATGPLDYQSTLDIVASAFAMWPTTTCSDGYPSIAAQSTVPLTCPNLEYNPSGPNANAVLFRDTEWPKDEHHDPSQLALTTVTFNRRTGDILDADMEINTSAGDLTPDMLEYVITHEAGHFYGLDHSPDPNAVMYRSADFIGLITTNVVALTPDDVDAICAAYPVSRPVPMVCDFEPAKGFAPDCGGNVIASCAVDPRPPASSRAWMAPLGTVTIVATIALALSARRQRKRRSKIESDQP